MITRIGVENFQSLRKVDLELGKLTVIVGPSSSGKSAFLRAVKALVSNIPGKSFITTGEKQCAVIAAREDGVIVALGRGTKDHYLIQGPGDTEPLTFTKLGGKVPDEVTAALRIQPVKGSSINFSGQFDRPYLLDDSGAEVARTLGDLTKVNVIFEAARESNRRKLSASQQLKLRETDLETLTAQLPKYESLPTRNAAIREAEQALERAAEQAHYRTTIAGAVAAVATLSAAQAALAQEPAPVAVDISVNDVEDMLAQRNLLAQLITTIGAWQHQATEAQQQARSAAQVEESARTDLAKFFAELGSCPTCGADGEHMHPERVA